MDQIQLFLQKLGEIFGGQILMVLALCLAQVLTGVAVALKAGVFEWSRLGDFYRTIVAPKLMGWLAAVILARFVLLDYLPENLKIIGQGIEVIAFGAVVLALGGAVLENFQALGIMGTGTVSKALSAAGIPTPKKAAENEVIIAKNGGVK